ncbi:MAG: sigma-70 family RNA polymerase sigma factor [Mariniphaga sp.]|nr:sigma-70 family RNA polymerase sigma factor [Mariniphaga sp.]
MKRATLDREEFKILFDQQFDSVRRYILYRSGNAELATDIVQDAFMKLWEKRNKVNLKTSKELLFKMASDLYISRYRKEKLTEQYLKSFQFLNKEYSPQEQMEFNQLKQVYENALVGMGEKQRVVFLMSRVDEYKYSEIAENLNISVKAVEKRMNVALSYLRKILNRNE